LEFYSLATHRFGNPRLRHSAFAQQHHLDALALLGPPFPSQCCFQPPDLALSAFDHLFSPNQTVKESRLPTQKQLIPIFSPRHRNLSIQSAMEAISDVQVKVRELTVS
jgi:hypothetical protein